MKHWQLAVESGRRAFPNGFELGEEGLPWSRQPNRGFLRCLKGWGLALQERGRLAAALDTLRELLLLDPSDPLAARPAALGAALDLDRSEEALELAQAWEESEPAEVSYGRALALFGMSEKGKATHALQLALEAAPGHAAELLGPPRPSQLEWQRRWRRYPGALAWLKKLGGG